MSVPINAIGIAIICVFATVVILLACLPLMTKSSAYTPPPKRTSWSPPYNPGQLPSVTPTSSKVCLPGTLGYNGLVTCTRQTDCNSCTDKDVSLECVTINNTNNQILDPNTKELNPPVQIDLYNKGNGVCSGRGTQKSCDDSEAPLNCTDYWCDCGSGYKNANNDPTNCDVQVLSVSKPGSYCLPSYVNACNPYTSNTILSNTGKGSEWLCECKYPNLFVQNNEGSDCTVPIACGSLEPQTLNSKIAKVVSYQSTDPSCSALPGKTSVPGWQLCNSYPNQLVSSDGTQTVPCNAPTASYSFPIPGTNLSYDKYVLSPLADPKCNVSQFSNVCTVQIAYKDNLPFVTQVVRGSGNPNDLSESRVWPPYPSVLPFGLQRCPDNWKGDGTPGNPCIDGNGFSFSYLDESGQWNGKYLSLQDLRNVGYGGPDAVPCDTNDVCPKNYVCTPAGAPSTGNPTGICAPVCSVDIPCPSGFNCLNGVCNKILDVSCPKAVGIPNTLGGVNWSTVNTACVVTPICLESGLSLQDIPRSLKTPDNIFPVSVNNSVCSTVKAPVCNCTLNSENITCSNTTPCATGTCVPTPVSPKVVCTKDSQCDVNNNQFCSEKGVCSTGYCRCDVTGAGYTCVDPDSTNVCSSAVGTQPRLYDGSLDGPPVDDNGQPLGATCSCNGFTLDSKGDKVPLVPGVLLAANDDDAIWTCVPDPCYVAGSQSAYNQWTKQCACTADNSGGTYYSWNTRNGLPTCQRDPCNPDGVTSNLQVTCKDDSGCSEDAVTCFEKQCYIISTQKCSANNGIKDCGSVMGNGGPDSVQCLEVTKDNFFCAVKDPTRSTCDRDSDCALGICNSQTKLCTGGCLCSSGTASFFTDANPLHSACTNPCAFNPCGANGTCHTEGNKAVCTCNPGYAGDNCEYRSGCKGTSDRCNSDSECCSNSCSIWFFDGIVHRCDWQL